MYKKVLGIIVHRIDGKYYVVKNNQLYEINETGARIIELCDGKRDERAISHLLVQHYEMNETDVLNDVKNYCNNLVEMGVIKIV